MNNKEIITVSDLIEYLKTFPLTAPILKSDLSLKGYNRFRITEELPVYDVKPCIDPELQCEYVDDISVGPPKMQAVVL